MWTLVPEIRQDVESVLGHRVPDPSTPEFERFFATLERAHPELARKILTGLQSAPQVTLPSEAFLRRMRRRRLIRNALTRVLYKPTWPEGVVLDKRRVLGLVLVLFAGVLLPAVYLVNARVLSGRRAPSGQVVGHPMMPLAVAPGQGAPSRDGAPQSAALSPLADRTRGSVTAPLVLPPSSGDTLRVLPPEILAPSRNALQRPRSVAPDLPSGLELVPPPPLPRDAGTPHVFAFFPSEEHLSASRIFVFLKAEEPASDSYSPGAPRSAAVAPIAPGQQPPPQIAAADTPSFVPTQIQSQSAPSPWQPSQIITARLVTGIAMVQGFEPTPVLAISDSRVWCGREICPRVTWLGQVTSAVGRRVQVHFSTAFIDGRAHSIRAHALGSDMILGLPARISTRTSAVAGQIVSAAFAAASDYLKALSQQHQVTIANGWLAITERGNPDFWTHLLTRVTDLFGVQSSGPPTVEVAEVAPETEFRLLILANEGR